MFIDFLKDYGFKQVSPSKYDLILTLYLPIVLSVKEHTNVGVFVECYSPDNEIGVNIKCDFNKKEILSVILKQMESSKNIIQKSLKKLDEEIIPMYNEAMKD